MRRALDDIAHIFGLAMGFALMYPFYCILKYGAGYIQEPDKIILVAEIAIIVTLWLFILFNLIWRIVNGRKETRSYG